MVTFLLFGVAMVYAAVTVTGAIGGTAISADSGANSTTSGWTMLSGITIAAGSNSDFAKNQSGVTLILTPPINWKFKAGSGTVSYVTSKNIINASIVVTSTNLTVTFSTDPTANKKDTLYITGIWVQAIDATTGIGITGSIYRTVANPGTATILGITGDVTSFGLLSQAHGTIEPSTSLISPTSGTYFTTGNVSFSRSGSDNIAISGYTLKIYSGSTQIYTGSFTSGTTSTSFSTGDGNYTWNVVATDSDGNTGTATTNRSFTIDTTKPSANVIYSITGWTNQNVTGTVTGFSETITGLNVASHLFTGNGIFVFSFQDLAGNTGSTTGNVTWIDKISPTFAGVVSGTTYAGLRVGNNYTGEVTITFADEALLSGAILSGIDNSYYNGNFQSGSTIRNEGTYIFTVYDTAGHSTGATFTIQLSLDQKIFNTFVLNYGYTPTTATPIVPLPIEALVGTAAIDVGQFSGQLLIPVVLQSPTTYAGFIAEVEILDIGTVLKTASLDPFTGVIIPPIFQDPSTYAPVLGITPLSAIVVGTTGHIILKDTGNNDVYATIRMPVPGKNAGDLVDIYSSEDGINFDYLGTTHVKLLGGDDPYVTFSSNHFSVFVTVPNNGLNISADKAANSTSSGYTTLGNIVITEVGLQDFAPNQSNVTLILTPPSNWQFRAGFGTATRITGRNISAIDSTTVTSTGIRIQFDVNNGTEIDAITISGIQVQAISGELLSSAGNILRTCANGGTAVISGVTCDVTNFGSLSQIVGTAKNIITTLSGQTFIAGFGNSGTALNQTASISFDIVNLTTVDQFKNIVTTYTGNKTIFYSGPTSGTYTTGVLFTDGQSTTPLTTILWTLGTNVTITATDGVYTGIASSIFNVADIPDTTAPVLSGLVDIPTLTNDSTPNYRFHTTEAGTVSYSGDCISALTGATFGENEITLTSLSGGSLSDGLHSNCMIMVSDLAGNTGSLLINSFTVDTLSPTATGMIYSITGWTNQDVTATITGFSEPITGLNALSHLFTLSGTFDFNFQDLAGNTGSTTAIVTWIDKTPPVVTVSGSVNMTIYKNASYTEHGATWTDNVDGNGVLTGTTSGSVNTAMTGTYILTYSYTDQAGNSGSAQRSVEVSDTTLTIDIAGANPYYIEFGSGYIEYGATRTDTVDGSGAVTGIVNTVNTGVLGPYTVTYTYVNSLGNSGSEVRNVVVQDSTAPVVTLNGLGTIYITQYSGYTEQGATWTDFHDGSGTVSIISGSVIAGVVGTYYLDYIKVDNSGNTGSTTRTVYVQDITAPTVMLSTINTDPTNTGIQMTAQFSEVVTGFISTDISFANGTITGFVRVDGDTYEFTVVPNPANQGLETIAIYTGVCKDLEGNDNVASVQFSIIYDTLAPILTQITPVPSFINITTPSYTFSSNEAGLLSYSGDCSSITTGALSGNTTVIFNALGTGLHDNCVIRVRDAAGNTGSLNINSFTIDTATPTATIDYSPNSGNRINGNVTATLTGFSETLTGLNSENYIFTGNTSFTFTFSDLAGNTGATTATVDWMDMTGPVLTQVTPVPTPTTDTTPNYTFSSNKIGMITYSGDCSSITTGAISGNNTITFNVLGTGVHNNCEISVTDTALNISNRLAINSFTIEDIPVATTPDLGAATSFSILASTYTNTTIGTINGNLGYTTAPATTPTVNGTIYTGGATYTGAGADQTTALSALNAETCNFSFGAATDLASLSQPLVPGVYCIAGVVSIDGGATITLSGAGTYIFRASGALNTSVSSHVTLTNGALAFDVFWAPIGATTLGASSTFIGTVIDDAGITLGANIVWTGRALGFNGTVTTDTDIITAPVYVDITPPTAQVEYTPGSGVYTSGNVLSILTGFSEAVTGLNATGYLFTGNYSFIYVFYDLAGNTGYATGSVYWIDKISPIFSGVANGDTYMGSATITFSDNNLWVTAILSGMDISYYSGDFQNGTTVSSTGTYMLTVYDLAGNSTGSIFTIETPAPDAIPPTITLLGANPYIIEVGTPYVELGATASDNIDGDITSQIIIDTGTIIISVTGFYTGYYTVSDSSGNPAITGMRTVNAVDTTPPMLTLSGDNPQTIIVLSPYIELGATAYDTGDGDMTSQIIINTGDIITSVTGSYTVYYNVSDSSGNAATTGTRTVNVISAETPVITLLGSTPINIEIGSSYIDSGTTAFDNQDGDITSSIITTGSVNTGATGSYTVYYNVSDSSGNAAIQVIRTVNVIDTTKPVIILLGSTPINIEIGSIYIDSGATASDNFYGDLTSSIIVSGSVDTENTGSYLITYDVTDINGNTGSQIMRTVIVQNTILPVISDLSSTVLSSTTTQIKFTTNIPAQGFVRYGIGMLSDLQTGTTGTAHSILLTGLNPITTYIYKAFAKTSAGTGELSNTGTFTTPFAITTYSVTGMLIVTGATVHVEDALDMGATFLTTGILIMINEVDALELELDGLSIYASGVRDKTLFPPQIQDTGLALPILQIEPAGIILKTVKVGGNVGLQASPGKYFRIKIYVPGGSIGQTLKVFRSDDTNIWTANDPDISCTLDSSRMCTFLTDHLSYFSTLYIASLSMPGGSTEIKKDLCPQGDLSPSYYDGACEFVTTIFGGETEGVTTQGNINHSLYSKQLNDAYLFAFEYGITTIPTIQKANIEGKLLRSHMAKMVANYATKVLGKFVDTSLPCSFGDVSKESEEMQFYAKLACQLRLMGVQANGDIAKNFSPNGVVTRAEFGTILSRLLYGDIYNGGTPYYLNHLNALKDFSIMITIDQPTMAELRGYVMLMLMRSAQK